MAITKLSPPAVFVRFDYGDSYFASFDEFVKSLTIVEWIGGEIPDDDEREAILTDCWNFLAEHEAEEENRFEDFADDF